jgi:phosphinothricin acetyltransferase
MRNRKELTDMTIRTATEADAEQLLDIYRPYIEKTAISFEYEVPTVEEFAGRIRKTLEKYPYLVAVEDGEIVGYSYASSFIGRRAYDWSVETSIYLKMGCTKKGYGKALYQKLEETLKKQNIQNIDACIAVTETADPYVDNNSMEFHEHLGYQLVARFPKSGCKFGRWYDMVWMEKCVGTHPENPDPVIPFSELQEIV